MIRSFGEKQMTKPEGMLRAINFPALAFVETFTGDGRYLRDAGGAVRELPQTIWGQFSQGDGHSGAVIIGSLREVTFGEDGVISGSGWLLDDENGRQAAMYLSTGSMRGNSVDLADVKASFEWDEERDDIAIYFDEWNIAGTTLVGRPAFKDAHASLDEELVASWMSADEPLVADLPVRYNVVTAQPEVMASGEKRPPWDLFHAVEPSKPHKLTVGEPREDGYIPVFGHIAAWNSCHDAFEGCLMVPRPADGYSGFNTPGVLTDKGMVNTGPIFLRHGHPKAGELETKTVSEAYGGIENAWADVRVIPGIHGPFASGYVRPGTSEEAIIQARASKVSGHWKGGALKAVVSVNVPGYEVPGGESFALDADGSILELVASFPDCFNEDTASDEQTVVDDVDETIADTDDEFALVDLELELAIQDMDDD